MYPYVKPGFRQPAIRELNICLRAQYSCGYNENHYARAKKKKKAKNKKKNQPNKQTEKPILASECPLTKKKTSLLCFLKNF